MTFQTAWVLSSHTKYADDTTIYLLKKPTILKDGEKRLQQALNDLATWSADCNLWLKVSSCYNSLSLIRKQLAESLVFSKLYYNDIVYIITFLITFLITSLPLTSSPDCSRQLCS